MAAPIDAFRYMSYMRSRWRLIAATCGCAVVLSTVFSLLETRQYTAMVRVVIEAPAGSDLRAAMAVSPIYLESLRTYEEFANSDSLFLKAIDQLHLRPMLGGRPIESLKKRVLKVELVRNTRILEISATLPDARESQALAYFLAQSAVELNRSLVTAGDQDLLQGLERQQAAERATVDQLEAQWAHLLATEPVDDLRAALEGDADLRAKLEQDLLSFQVEVADAAQREKQATPAEAGRIRTDSADTQARIAELRSQIAAVDRRAAEREKLLALRLADREKLDPQRKAAHAGLTAIESRLREARADTGFRGERLQIIDPGIVPERPSSPNLPLNIAAALLAGFVLPMFYLAIELNFVEQRARGRRDFLAARG